MSWSGFRSMSSRRDPALARQGVPGQERARPGASRDRLRGRGPGAAARVQRDHSLHRTRDEVRRPVLRFPCHLGSGSAATALTPVGAQREFSPAPAGPPTSFIHLSRRHRPCRTATPTSDAPAIASAIGGRNRTAPRPGVSARAVDTIVRRRAAVSARCVLRNAVLPIESAPGNARPQASGVSGIPRPARPNTGAPAGVRMNASHRENAPGAPGIRTSRIGRLCVTCGQRQRRRDRERYAEARDAGAKYGGRDVHARRRQARRRSRKRRRHRRQASLCIRCARRAPVENGSSCQTCLNARRIADRGTYAARRASGLCTRCAAPTFEGAPLCGPCTVTRIQIPPGEVRCPVAPGTLSGENASSVRTAAKPPTFGASRCQDCSKRAYERSEHVRGIPYWEPACTVIDGVSGDPLGTWDRWEDAVLALSFEGLSLDDVELVAERSPVHAMIGWS